MDKTTQTMDWHPGEEDPAAQQAPSPKEVDRKLHASLSRLATEAAQQAPATPAPATPAAAEPLSLDRYTRTAVQVGISDLTDEAAAGSRAAAAAEDRAIERVQALLTPAARLQLAVEQLEALGAGHISLGEGAEGVALLRSLGALVQEEMAGRHLREHARHTIGRVCVFAQHTRPASLDDARRLLEGR